MIEHICKVKDGRAKKRTLKIARTIRLLKIISIKSELFNILSLINKSVSARKGAERLFEYVHVTLLFFSESHGNAP